MQRKIRKRKYNSEVLKHAIHEYLFMKDTLGNDVDVVVEHIAAKHNINIATLTIMAKNAELIIDKFVDSRANIKQSQIIAERI